MATKKKKKPDKYTAEATRLANSRFSAAFEQIAANTKSNLSAYNTGAEQRVTSLNKELGSMEGAHQAAQKQLTQYGAETGTLYQQAIAKSQSEGSAAVAKQNSMATGLMTSLQSERNARGLSTSTGSESNLANNLGKQSELLSSINQVNQEALTRQGANAGDLMKSFKVSEGFLDTTHKSAAKGLAQSELMGLYNTYLEKKMALEGERTVTEKERGDYIVQTAMTLKEQARQAAAQKAAQALQASIAAGNLGFKYENLAQNIALKKETLAVNTQWKYDNLSQKSAQQAIENDLKRQGLAANIAKSLATQGSKDREFGLKLDQFDFNKWKYNNPQPKAKNDSAWQKLMDALGS